MYFVFIYTLSTGWLKVKYSTRQYAISWQPVVRFKKKILKLFNPDISPNPTFYNVSAARTAKTISMKTENYNFSQRNFG